MECTYFWGGRRRGAENLKSVPQILLGLVMLFEFMAESTLRIFTSFSACQTCTKQNSQAYLIAPRLRCTGTKLPDKIRDFFSCFLSMMPYTWPDNFPPTSPICFVLFVLVLLFTFSALQRDDSILSLRYVGSFPKSVSLGKCTHMIEGIFKQCIAFTWNKSFFFF